MGFDFPRVTKLAPLFSFLHFVIPICTSLSLTMTETITSAPAKVILFGEHLVVHGATALTTALDLRTYVRLSALQGETHPLIHINLPDIKADVKIAIADLKYTGM